jgi:hypothetical protein
MTQGRQWIQNASPQPSPGSPDPGDSHPLLVDPPPPAHNNLPLDIDLNTSPHPGQQLKDGSDSGSHLTGSMSPWSWYEMCVVSKSPSSSLSHDYDPLATLSDLGTSGSYSTPLRLRSLAESPFTLNAADIQWQA